jgi:hypothetical protein
MVRVSQQHKELLYHWQKIVTKEDYLLEQAKPAAQRNQHMLGDQDALSALLASEEFCSIPVRPLRHSVEILQHHGAGAYGPVQRWSNLIHGMSPVIHAMGTVKPWKMPDRPRLLRSPRDYYERAYLELSPYVHFARRYRAELEEDDGGWLDIRTLAGVLGTVTSFNWPLLKGILQASFHRFRRH